ncbi:superoxide dismutase [Candidatus Gottesmanbacteria bacterium RIFCSPHIGHO2_02_FULL_40_13]|uniref:Superoxide dismutase n=1 Tax=Candidatus Gottesmanbacteria bacterium RIFCSPHIGHO2_02_FULL_40_13 TaxID=1798384 RepID=A0A1F6A7T8_9BACT|nr:MAG: superoxide dismutase [Candidatus Gottesmanbacteria bacterium RIFCSPHIGHO2_02_FULL_40_13]
MKYQLPALPYAYDALEPYIDKETMEIHHAKHHQGYTNNLNAVLDKYPQLADTPLEELIKTIDRQNFDANDKAAFQNNAGGYLNHKLFWEIMGPEKSSDKLLNEEIIKQWGSLDEFKKVFAQTALSRFGSGWAWLARNTDEKLEVYSLPNQDSPFLKGHMPLIGLDVWEHAYYLKYQNRRQEYIENWWHVLNVIK